MHEAVGHFDVGIGGGVVRHSEHAELFGATTYADERLDGPDRSHERESCSLFAAKRRHFLRWRLCRCHKYRANQPPPGWPNRGSINSNSCESKLPPNRTSYSVTRVSRRCASSTVHCRSARGLSANTRVSVPSPG